MIFADRGRDTWDLIALLIAGYANAKIYKCDNEKCPPPGCYTSAGSSKDDSFPCLRPACTGRYQLVRHVSFVDCPGHDILMATMLNGAAVMDAALLLIGKLISLSLILISKQVSFALFPFLDNVSYFLLELQPRTNHARNHKHPSTWQPSRLWSWNI